MNQVIELNCSMTAYCIAGNFNGKDNRKGISAEVPQANVLFAATAMYTLSRNPSFWA